MVAPKTWDVSPTGALARISGRTFATTTEAAAILHCDPRTIRSAIEAGQIPGVFVGATLRVPTQWLREQITASAPD